MLSAETFLDYGMITFVIKCFIVLFATKAHSYFFAAALLIFSRIYLLLRKISAKKSADRR